MFYLLQLSVYLAYFYDDFLLIFLIVYIDSASQPGWPQNWPVTAAFLLEQVFYPVDCWSASHTACCIYFSPLYHGHSLLLSVRIMNPYVVFILYYCNAQYSSIFGFGCIRILGFTHMICECSLWCETTLCFFVMLLSWIICLMGSPLSLLKGCRHLWSSSSVWTAAAGPMGIDLYCEYHVLIVV